MRVVFEDMALPESHKQLCVSMQRRGRTADGGVIFRNARALVPGAIQDRDTVRPFYGVPRNERRKYVLVARAIEYQCRML
ncbi:MAG: hypothetical protein LBS62_13555 [Clostridiales bacterium]|jgi:hypothetical protein|nr:hypothetical protein [Clostridiales bacterium]